MGICAKKTEAPKQQINKDVIETTEQKVEKEDKIHQSNSTIKIITNSQKEKPPHSFEKSLHEGGQKVIDQQNNKNEYDEIFDKFQINHDTQFRQNKQIIGHKNQEVKDESISNDPPKLSLTFVKSQLLTSKQIKKRAKQKIEQDLQALLENLAQKQTKQQQQKETQQKYGERQNKNEQQQPQQEVKNLIQLQRQIEDYMVKEKEKEKEKEKQTIKNHITYRPNMKKTSINRKQYQEWKPPI